MPIEISGSIARLTYSVPSLVHEISDYAYVNGELQSDENITAKRYTQDVEADGNIDRITKRLNMAYEQVVSALYPYTKEDVKGGEEAGYATERQGDTLTVRLQLPIGFSQTTLRAIYPLIQEYMVSSTLADWLGIVGVESASTWSERSDDALSKIRKLMLMRRCSFSRKQRPF